MKQTTTCLLTRYAMHTLVLTAALLLSAAGLKAQQTPGGKEVEVTLKTKGLTLAKVFGQIEQQTGLNFIYDERELKTKLTAVYDLPQGTTRLSRLLELISKQSGLHFERVGKTIAVHNGSEKVAANAHAEPEILAGRVIDAANQGPLAGATIEVEETKQSAITNEDGQFHIPGLKPGQYHITVSYVGYQRVRIAATTFPATQEGKGLDIKMQIGNSLDDMVVVGYGTVKKKDLTGSVGKVNMDDLNKAPVSSFDQALAGRLAGVMVASNEGQPGSPINIVIRGNNSITQDNSPLYVIDGFPIENPDNNVLNPDDIESIDVLKDASATAIYGARGSNGVIIITTKRGKMGAPVLRYSGYYGEQQNIREIPVMSPYEFVKLEQEIGVSDLDSTYLANGVTVDDYKNVKGIDWQSKLYRTSPMMNHYVSLTGGTDKTHYAMSGELFNQDGIIINSGFKREQLKMSLDQTVDKRLRTGVNILYTYTQTYGTQPSALSNSSMNNLLYSVWGYRPAEPLKPSSETGDDFEDALTDGLVNPGTDYRINPLLDAQNELRRRNINNIIGNAYAEYSVLKDLKLRVTAGINKTIQRNDAFNNSNTRSGNPAGIYGVNGTITYYQTTNWLNENTLTYDKRFGENHRLNLLAGWTMQGNDYQTYGLSANHLPNETLGLNGLNQGTPQPVASYESQWSLASGLARVNYSFMDRYLLTASFRADGSSKFRNNNQWSYFPSGAVAWRIINEAFMKPLRFVSDAKLRASWGITGNNRVSEYATYASLGFPLNDYYSFGNELTNGSAPTGLASEDLKWENTAQTDIGLDLGFLKQRLSLTIDYYKKITSNLLLNAQLPPTTGYGSAYKNVGRTSNQGLELALNTVNITTSKFTWSTSLNISFNRSRVLALTQNQQTLTTNMSWDSFYGDPLYIAMLGQPVGQFYGYIWDGVYQYSDFNKLPNGTYVLKDNVPNNGNTRANIKPGDIRYRDINGDNVVDANDKTVIGRGFPIHFGGITNNFRYANFDLNVFFQWSYGNDIFDANRLNFENGNKSYLNQYASFENRWTPEHTNTRIPRASGQYGYMYSSRVVENGSYLRLKTAQLGYTLPAGVAKLLHITSCRFYVAGQNLWTLTRYKGSDPEVSIAYSALTPGFDYSSYPRARTATFGLNITF
ncbi:MAG TPA: TonB-dependent receptor [Puia sp.]|nr:TonB-dependent receptor [Puia sp.]